MTPEELNTLEALLKKANEEDQLVVFNEEEDICWIEYIYTDNNVLIMNIKNK